MLLPIRVEKRGERGLEDGPYLYNKWREHWRVLIQCNSCGMKYETLHPHNPLSKPSVLYMTELSLKHRKKGCMSHD